ncbi:MAG: MotA/TolQ/ExbB proton channel family protein [Actinobacteria bacterium]|nr:MotA/TolQ/ExbB proton channel family protein [Actinomycetota bacterium]
MGDLVSVQELLHVIAQVMLVPTIVVVLILIAFVVYQLGALVVEALGERRRLKTSIPELIREVNNAKIQDLAQILEGSGILRRQKKAVTMVLEYRDLSVDSLEAIAKGALTAEQIHYLKKLSHTDLIARIGPMLGLMGTLIPLGPGIVALSAGDTATLAQSLLTAFDTTVAGLIIASVSYAISTLRRRWYAVYTSSLEALMVALLDRILEDEAEEIGQEDRNGSKAKQAA